MMKVAFADLPYIGCAHLYRITPTMPARSITPNWWNGSKRNSTVGSCMRQQPHARWRLLLRW